MRIICILCFFISNYSQSKNGTVYELCRHVYTLPLLFAHFGVNLTTVFFNFILEKLCFI